MAIETVVSYIGKLELNAINQRPADKIALYQRHLSHHIGNRSMLSPEHSETVRDYLEKRITEVREGFS